MVNPAMHIDPQLISNIVKAGVTWVTPAGAQPASQLTPEQQAVIECRKQGGTINPANSVCTTVDAKAVADYFLKELTNRNNPNLLAAGFTSGDFRQWTMADWKLFKEKIPAGYTNLRLIYSAVITAEPIKQNEAKQALERLFGDGPNSDTWAIAFMKLKGILDAVDKHAELTPGIIPVEGSGLSPSIASVKTPNAAARIA